MAFALYSILAFSGAILIILELSFFTSFIGLMAFLVSVMWITSIPWSMLIAHPLALIFGIVLYIVIGAQWVWFAWMSYLRDLDEKYVGARNEWCERHGHDYERFTLASLSADEVADFRLWMRSAVGCSVPFKVSDHKVQLISWMTFWPFSMLQTILNDPIRRFFILVYNTFAKGFQRIADRMLATMKNDFTE